MHQTCSHGDALRSSFNKEKNSGWRNKLFSFAHGKAFQEHKITQNLFSSSERERVMSIKKMRVRNAGPHGEARGLGL